MAQTLQSLHCSPLLHWYTSSTLLMGLIIASKIWVKKMQYSERECQSSISRNVFNNKLMDVNVDMSVCQSIQLYLHIKVQHLNIPKCDHTNDYSYRKLENLEKCLASSSISSCKCTENFWTEKYNLKLVMKVFYKALYLSSSSFFYFNTSSKSSPRKFISSSRVIKKESSVLSFPFLSSSVFFLNY